MILEPDNVACCPVRVVIYLWVDECSNEEEDDHSDEENGTGVAESLHGHLEWDADDNQGHDDSVDGR